MAWIKAFILTLTASLGISGTAEALRTSFTISELREITANDALLRSKSARDTDPSLLYPTYTLDVPVDHFHNDSLYEPHSKETFPLRYWFDASNYKPGGPVIVLQGGETSGLDRLPYLQKGIVAILTQATGGVGVILEHRYYGNSFPTADLSVESLRFLTTDQALADQAYFSKHVQFKGLEDVDLTAPNAAHIAYGGSYAGAFVAFLRKLYPDVYWGAIASSAVTEAIYDFWEYYEAARVFAPGDCATNTQKFTTVVDNILIGKNGTAYVLRLKNAFGLGNVTGNADFANSLNKGITGLQSTNWDPALNSTSYGTYCDTISNTSIIFPAVESRRSEVAELIKAGGLEDELDTLINPMLNYIGYIDSTVVTRCQRAESQDACLTNNNPVFYRQDDLTQTWRSWPWQWCNEWGYLQTGSGTPPDQPAILSRLIDLQYISTICRLAFNITTEPKLERINQWGGFNISYPRLAFVDGEHDPWRQASPHAIGLPDRTSTTSEPFILIDDGVHHWDENGLFPNQTTAALPPGPVKEAQQAEVDFVKAWMVEWKESKNKQRNAQGPQEL